MSTEEETPDPPVKGPPVAANPHRAGMAQRIVTILGQLRGIDETIDTLFGEMRFDATTEAQREGLRLVMDLLEEDGQYHLIAGAFDPPDFPFNPRRHASSDPFWAGRISQFQDSILKVPEISLPEWKI